MNNTSNITQSTQRDRPRDESAISVTKAWEQIRQELPDWGSETCDLTQATNRILSADIQSDRDQPPFHRVAMDGISIDFADWQNGQRTFSIEATHQAGVQPPDTKENGTCFEVMTGAVLPPSCNCVIPYEELTREDENAVIHENTTATHMQFVHQLGTDQSSGDTLLKAGTKLLAPQIAIAASVGAHEVPVYRLPSVALITSGDELVPVDHSVKPWQIRQSNRPAAEAALTQHGFPPAASHHLPDDKAQITETLQEVLASQDVIILGGGVSKGKYDFVPDCLAELGVNKVFHRVRQRPGKPMWFGVGQTGQLVFALPGNPVSFLTCLYRYVLPALNLATRQPPRHPDCAVLTEAITITKKLTTFIPVIATQDPTGTLHATPAPTKGSGDFCSLAPTTGCIELQEGAGEYPRGHVLPYVEW